MLKFRTFWVTVVWVGSMFLSGCAESDECPPGESKCDGMTVLSCQTPYYKDDTPTRWRREVCEAVCVIVPGENSYALCALSEEVDSRCDGAFGSICDGDTLVDCTSGFATDVEECQSCVVTATNDFCAVSDVQDPMCGSEPSFEFCRDNTRVQCRNGYRTDEQTCTACIENDGFSTCAASEEPYPPCADAMQGGVHCLTSQGERIACFDEYLVEEDPNPCL